MQRRNFLACLTAGFAWPALAQMSEQGSEMPANKPFREVSRVFGDQDRVFSFFMVTCPFCRELHDRIDAWGASLPAALAFEFVPVVTADRDSIIAARAYYAARAAGPAAARAFLAAAYSAVQDKSMPVSNPATWQRVAHVAGLGDTFTRQWAGVSRDKILTATRRLANYRIDSTPSIAVGGRYVITPDNVDGNLDVFMQLANGMVSKHLSETGRAPA